MKLLKRSNKMSTKMTNDMKLIQLLVHLRFGSPCPNFKGPPVLNLESISRMIGISTAHIFRLLKPSP